MKLNHPRLSRHLPSQVRLPSPSHSPPLIDLLPLPPGLAEILSGRASDGQTRASRSGRVGRRPLRTGPATTMFAPVRHGVFPAPVAETDGPPIEAERQAIGVQEPLVLPSPADGTSGTRGKAPRVRGMKVQVDSSWLLENVVTLWSHLVGAVEYLVITVRDSHK